MKTFLFRTNDPQSLEHLMNHVSFINDINKGKQVDYQWSYKKNNPVRSNSANGRYWLLLQAIAAITGDTKEDLHEIYKIKFNGKEIRGVVIGQTTTDLDTAEFNVYMKKVEEHGRTFHGAYFAHPEDKHYAIWEQQTKERYNALFAAI